MKKKSYLSKNVKANANKIIYTKNFLAIYIQVL